MAARAPRRIASRSLQKQPNNVKQQVAINVNGPSDDPPDDDFIDGQAGESSGEGLAEEYIRREKEFDETEATRRIYAKSSDELIERLKKSWSRYCTSTQKDPVECLRLFNISTVATFFHWLLRTRQATLRKASTLQTYWNTLCLLRKAETGLHIIPQELKASMVGVRQRLAREFKLETVKAAKPIIRAEDEFELLKTLWSSPLMLFKHERLRVQLALIAQLAGITGNRPGALLALRYGDLKVTLLRDPDDPRQSKILLEITFNVSKTYHGPKEPNTFPIPEVCADSCLSLCPQIMLLGLLFADEAFAAPGLSGPEQLFRLRVPNMLNQLLLPMKDDLLERPIFQDTQQTAYGTRMCPSKHLSASNLRTYFSKWGQITGFELPLKPYAFRRGNGEALDSSAYISDAQRNVILQHATSRVYERNYLPRYITQDTQAAYRGLVPQAALTKHASGMTRTIDTRQPRHLNLEQLGEVDRHPELQLISRKRHAMRKRLRVEYGSVVKARGTKLGQAYLELRKECERKRKAICRRTLKLSQSDFRKQQALTDIAEQLHCSDLEEKTNSESTSGSSEHAQSDPLSDERIAVFVALLSQPSDDYVTERQRRSVAINAVSCLCNRQEPGDTRAGRPKRRITPFQNHAPQHPTHTANTLKCGPTQCIFCLGDPELDMKLRKRSFGDFYTLRGHFTSAHLSHLPDDEPIKCPHPQCTKTLLHKDHLRKHALEVHNTRT